MPKTRPPRTRAKKAAARRPRSPRDVPRKTGLREDTGAFRRIVANRGAGGKEEKRKRSLPGGNAEGRGVFCVQKHDATRLHYDVRLEIAGTLMSFAVPKGPSYDPQVKRLAVETEDHPMMYADFEARIPEGQYGAGDMLLWDLGTYETVPPGQEVAMRAKGHLHVRFFGEKLRGGWHFVRTKGTAAAGGDAAAKGDSERPRRSGSCSRRRTRPRTRRGTSSPSAPSR